MLRVRPEFWDTTQSTLMASKLRICPQRFRAKRQDTAMYRPPIFRSSVWTSVSRGKDLGRFSSSTRSNACSLYQEEIGLAVVILDVIEDGGAEEIARRTRFYERLGFQSMPSATDAYVFLNEEYSRGLRGLRKFRLTCSSERNRKAVPK